MTRLLTTPGLLLCGAEEAFAWPLASFLLSSRAHLDPWSPLAKATFFTEDGQPATQPRLI
jgi:hypothetical protein